MGIAVIIVAFIFFKWLKKGFVPWILIVSLVGAVAIAWMFGGTWGMRVYFFLATLVCWYVLINALYALYRESKALKNKNK